jgi:hypothetical protein
MVRGNKKGIGLGTIASIRALIQHQIGPKALILLIIK